MLLLEPEPEPEPECRLACYRCGAPGHARQDCPNPENPMAVAALKQFRQARKQRRKQQRRAAQAQEGSVPNKQRDRAGKIRAWLSVSAPCGSDPIATVLAQGSKRQQLDLAAASRAYFLAGIRKIAAELARRVGGVGDEGAQASAGKALTQALGVALKDGAPADFSDEVALAAYTRKRLSSRCCYLYTLLMCDDALCSAARALLLPSPVAIATNSGTSTSGTTPATIDSNSRPMRKPADAPLIVLSIGGGPAFDDVALRLAASFLASTPCVRSHSLITPL